MHYKYCTAFKSHTKLRAKIMTCIMSAPKPTHTPHGVYVWKTVQSKSSMPTCAEHFSQKLFLFEFRTPNISIGAIFINLSHSHRLPNLLHKTDILITCDRFIYWIILFAKDWKHFPLRHECWHFYPTEIWYKSFRNHLKHFTNNIRFHFALSINFNKKDRTTFEKTSKWKLNWNFKRFYH